ncbi:MAG TPA: succinate dehydrogenase assembly factor 2 [Steroidobacteraceae bacterium]|nr:succinate dehydrogenase assembly factor 2 [Steroidobacteraceae bacterium]
MYTLSQADERRMLWRCRRGMKELDVLLERYVHLHLPGASSKERRAFARLLELPDPLLADYLFGHDLPPEQDLAALAQRISGRPVSAA